MKLYNIDFEGMWPVGSCLIVLANDEDEARSIAKRTIKHTDEFKIEEIDMTKSGVVAYLSGEY